MTEKIFFTPGAPACPGGDVDQTVTSAVVKLINDRRTALVEGTQKNGNSGKNLPPAKGMTAIVSYFNLYSTKYEGQFFFKVVSRMLKLAP